MRVFDHEIAMRRGIRKSLEDFRISHAVKKAETPKTERLKQAADLSAFQLSEFQHFPSRRRLSEALLADHRNLDRAWILQLLLDALAEFFRNFPRPVIRHRLGRNHHANLAAGLNRKRLLHAL